MTLPDADGPRGELLLRSRKFCVRRVAVAGGRSVDLVLHPGAAVILPVLDDGRLLLIENHRHTLGRALLELPAGTLEPSEPPAACAARELREETGYTAERVASLVAYYPTPGFCNEHMHLFVASGLRPGDPRREPTERIENRPMAYEDALAACGDGRIVDGKTLVGLLYYDRFGRGRV